MQNTEVWIYTLPKYPNIKDNPAFEFARKKNRNVIDGYDKINKKWIDLATAASGLCFLYSTLC